MIVGDSRSSSCGDRSLPLSRGKSSPWLSSGIMGSTLGSLEGGGGGWMDSHVGAVWGLSTASVRSPPTWGPELPAEFVRLSLLATNWLKG